jgi:MerR family transcriptional regulator, light-induced transcriptional regulator
MAFSIKELESLSGIKAHTIRIWEQRYSFLKPSRTQTNIRTYNNEELKTLLTVALLNKYGYKISRIDEMPPDQRQKAILDLPGEEAYNEHLINRMVGCMVDLKGLDFEIILDKYIGEYGIERTLSTIIFGFMEKVGILWQTNRILPVQEHVVSNIIRQKMIRAIDSLPFVTGEENLFILCLPEGEFHEIGLLSIYYLLRKNSQQVIYLGSNVPSTDLSYLINVKNPPNLFIHLTATPKRTIFQRFLQKAIEANSDLQVFISGSASQDLPEIAQDRVRGFQSFTQVLSYIEGLPR